MNQPEMAIERIEFTRRRALTLIDATPVEQWLQHLRRREPLR
jgi:hypothetical protein